MEQYQLMTQLQDEIQYLHQKIQQLEQQSLLSMVFGPLDVILPVISRIVTREPTVFTLDKRTIAF